MGRPLRDVYPHATRWQVFKWKVQEFLKKVLRFVTLTGITAGVLYATFMAGAYLNPVVSYATQEVLVPTDGEIPVLDRIARCESGDSHFDKSGQVLVRGNTGDRKSVDVGRYQINVSYWGAKATELGYDIFTEKGNRDMALWIYKNRGTEPWHASSKCWK